MIQWQLKSFDNLSPGELYSILRLRQEVFIVEQNCPYLDADGKDQKSLHLMGFIEGNLAAYARIVPPHISYREVSIGRVVTSPSHRKKEYGKLLMNEAIAEIEKKYGKVDIRIGAQQYLRRFYEGFGFIQVGAPYLEDGIPHIYMIRKG